MRKIILICIIILAAVSGYFMLSGEKGNGSHAEKIKVTDTTNTEVTMPLHPKRVVVLNPSNLEIYAAVGGKPIGKPTSSSYPKDLLPVIKDIPEIGKVHAVNAETILGLKPDLVIGINVPFHVMLRDTLADAGVPLYINNLDSFKDVLKTVDFYGKLADTEEKAKLTKEKIQNDYAELVKGVKENSRGKNLIIFGTADSFSMATKNSFGGDLLRRLGGENIADSVKNPTDSAYIPMSMEYISKANPERIMLITMGNPGKIEANLKKQFTENPVWKDISAVKNGKIYRLPANLFTVNPGTHIIQSMQLMKNILDGK